MSRDTPVKCKTKENETKPTNKKPNPNTFKSVLNKIKAIKKTCTCITSYKRETSGTFICTSSFGFVNYRLVFSSVCF